MNKTKIPAIIVLFLITMTVFIFILSSCGENRRKGWGHYNRKTDMINTHLDSIYRNRGISIRDTTVINELVQDSEISGDNNLKALALYWKAHAIRMNFPDSAAKLIINAKELCDSTQAPYLNSRIRFASAYMTDTDLRITYTTLRNLLDYYKTLRDTAMMIQAYRQLGTFYLNIHDLESYHECSEKTERLYLSIGQDSLAAKNRMNFALYHILHGDSAAAAKVIKNLLDDKNVRKDSVFMGRLYVNIANLFHDPDSMARALEISTEFRNDSSKRFTIEFAIARLFDKRGDIQKCDSILNYLSPIILEAGDYEAKKRYYDIISKRHKNAGNTTEALNALEKSQNYADSMAAKERSSEIDDYIHQDKVRRIDLEYEQEKYSARIRWMITLLSGVFIASLICFWFWDRHRRSQLARVRAERDLAHTSLSLEKEKRSLVAIGLVMSERDNLMKDVSQALDDMGDNGRISVEDKLRVNQMIKMSQNTRQDWEEFKKIYEKVHPDFLKRLTVRFPCLSEGDVRLALHISIGLSSKQIAQIMHIRLDSVKKNRQRLRRHMGINSSDSLEETLRNIL